MLHISKAKDGCIGYVVADNGEILSTTEILKNKAAVIKNFVSQLNQFTQYQTKKNLMFIYQDNTLVKPAIFVSFKDIWTGKLINKRVDDVLLAEFGIKDKILTQNDPSKKKSNQ